MSCTFLIGELDNYSIIKVKLGYCLLSRTYWQLAALYANPTKEDAKSVNDDRRTYTIHSRPMRTIFPCPRRRCPPDSLIADIIIFF